MSKTSHSRRAFFAGLVALMTSATTIATPSVSTAASGCGPLGTVQTYALNDRCDYGLLDLGLVTDSVIVDSLRRVGLFASLVLCTSGGLSTAAVVAVPDELLVTAAGPQRLNEAVAEVSRRLWGAVTGVTRVNDFAATLTLRPGTARRGIPPPGRPHPAGAGVQHGSQLPRAGPAEQRLPPSRQSRRRERPGEGPRWRCAGPGRRLAGRRGRDTHGDGHRPGRGLRRRGQRLRRRGSRPRGLRRLAHRAGGPEGRGSARRCQRGTPPRLGPLVTDGVLRC